MFLCTKLNYKLLIITYQHIINKKINKQFYSGKSIKKT